MSEYKNTQLEAQEAAQKADVPGEVLHGMRTDAHENVNDVLQMDAHAVAVAEFRRFMKVDEYHDPDLRSMITKKDELLSADPYLLNDPALRADIAAYAGRYLKAELAGVVAAFGLGAADVQNHMKPVVLEGLKRMMSKDEQKGILTMFPGLPDDPEWHDAARPAALKSLRAGSTDWVQRLRDDGLLAASFFDESIRRACEVGIADLLRSDYVFKAKSLIDWATATFGNKEAWERVFDESVRHEVRELSIEGAEDGEPTDDGKRFFADPSLVRTDRETQNAYEAWCDRLRPAWTMNRFVDAYAMDIPLRGSQMRLTNLPEDFKKMPHVAMVYCQQKLERLFPNANLRALQLSADPTTKNAYYRLGSNVVTVPADELLLDLFESIGEEAGHAIRHAVGPEGERNEEMTHEFFGFLGRMMLFEQVKNVKTSAFFQKHDGATRVSGGDEINFLYGPRSLRRRNQQTRARKTWTRTRSRLRSEAVAAGEQPQLSNHRAREKVIQTPARAKDRELLVNYESSLIHQRGYKYAAMHFTPDVMGRVDFEKVFSLPDEEVRKRFFRPDPDFSGLWRVESGEKPA